MSERGTCCADRNLDSSHPVSDAEPARSLSDPWSNFSGEKFKRRDDMLLRDDFPESL
jgi:hypothetical protein